MDAPDALGRRTGSAGANGAVDSAAMVAHYPRSYFLLTALLISLKRSAFLVGIVIILVQVTKIRLKRNITPRTLFGGVLSIAFLIGSMAYLVQSTEVAQYFDIMSRRLENIATDKGSGRLDLWAFASDLMSESNLYHIIFGYGFGWYHQNWQHFGTGIESLHNDVMEVWLSLGLVGVICYLAFLGRIAFLSLSIAKSRPELREFALSVFSHLSGLCNRCGNVLLFLLFRSPIRRHWLSGGRST